MAENNKKHQRMGSILAALAAEFVQSVSNKSTLITVTGCDLSESERRATILVTVLPEDAEQEAHAFLQRRRSDFRQYVKQNSRLRSIPIFDFAIDEGEKNRRRLDDIAKDM